VAARRVAGGTSEPDPAEPPAARVREAVAAGARVGDQQRSASSTRTRSGGRSVGAHLEALAIDGVRVLHDRRPPGRTGAFDHVAIGPSGVYVVVIRRYKGAIEVRDKGGRHTRDEHLYVGGRDRSRLVTSLVERRDRVANVLHRTHPGVRVTPVLCFVDPEESTATTSFRLRGVTVTWAKALQRLVASPGPLDPDEVDEITQLLAVRLPPA
jgi:hypothetical protein